MISVHPKRLCLLVMAVTLSVVGAHGQATKPAVPNAVEPQNGVIVLEDFENPAALKTEGKVTATPPPMWLRR